MTTESSLDWKALCSLGLSEYEASMYVALVKKGVSTAGDLSLTSGIPRTKAYLTLNKLKERHLVHEIPGRPRNYIPVRPAKAFANYLTTLKERTSDDVITLVKLHEMVDLLEKDYEQHEIRNKPQRHELWVLHDPSELLAKLGDVLYRAQNEIMIVASPPNIIHYYQLLRKRLEKLSEKGVKIRILTSSDGFSPFFRQELTYEYHVEHISSVPPLFGIWVDTRYCFISFLDDGLTEFPHGIFSDNLILSQLLKRLLTSHL